MVVCRRFTFHLSKIVVASMMLLIVPARDKLKAQTLLETWVFLMNFGLIDITDLKEYPVGTLKVPHPERLPTGGSVWTLKDKQTCELRMDLNNKYKYWEEYYLNNVLRNRVTYVEGGFYKIKLFGDQQIKCGYDPTTIPPETRCYKAFDLLVEDQQDVVRFERALDYLYSNFCHYAQGSKPF